MKFENFTITKREVLISIVIIFLLTTIGLTISNSIENNIEEQNEKYYKALKVDYEEEKFKYAINTDLGYVLARGKVKAVEGVHIDDIEGTYLKIRKEREEYTRHTREVEHTETIGNQTHTYYTTEVYYTWDYVSKEEFNSKQFEFLGVIFNYGTLNFNNSKYKEIKNVSSDVRYVYYVIPDEFEICLFTNIKNNTINENKIYYDNNIENIIESKQCESKTAKIFFWIIWILMIIGIVGCFVYAENKYLED